MARVQLHNVSKEFANGFVAVSNLDLDIKDGEFLVMVGPSGCGKSTTLRMIAGLETPTTGDVHIDEDRVNALRPRDRDIAMVFQNYALYPHMTVAENIGFPLKIQREKKDDIRRQVDKTARLLGLSDQLKKKPAQLSGGQRQRVAMGRAIIRRPKVFLLDEPLSNLDAKLRVQMRSDITSLQREVGVTTFYVTHDQVEAMTMADRVAVINRGTLQQVGSPQELFDHPHNLFVAAFLGSPSMNLLEVELTNIDGPAFTLGESVISLPEDVANSRKGLLKHVGKHVILGIRPKDVQDAQLLPNTSTRVLLPSKVENVESLGFEKIVYSSIKAKQVFSEDALELSNDLKRAANETSASIVGRFDPTSTVRIGEEIQIAISIENAHFFDPVTGIAIRN